MHNKKRLLLVPLMTTLLFTGCGQTKENIPIMESSKEETSQITEESIQTTEETGENFDNELYEEILEELNQYMADKDFDSLFSAYEDYSETYPELSDQLEEIKVQYVEQITNIFDTWIEEADKLMAEGDVQSARAKLNEIMAVHNEKFGELEVYIDIVSNRNDYYTEYINNVEPLSLMDGNPFDMGDGCVYRDETDTKYDNLTSDFFYHDRYENIYNKYYALRVAQTNEKGEKPYVIFNSDNKYDKFTASFVCHREMDEDKVFHVEIYGDDTLLYTSDSFTSYNEPMTIDIDITGYKFIKFMAVREDHNLTVAADQPSVGLYDASFYHSEVPEFEYYTPSN